MGDRYVIGGGRRPINKLKKISMTTSEKVKDIIAQTLNIDISEVTDSLAIGDIDQWDSMGNMAIVAAIEEQLGIEFPIEDLFELNSVISIITEIEKISK